MDTSLRLCATRLCSSCRIWLMIGATPRTAFAFAADHRVQLLRYQRNRSPLTLSPVSPPQSLPRRFVSSPLVIIWLTELLLCLVCYQQADSMNPRKRSAPEPLYPTRSAKHPRMTRDCYMGGSPSQQGGIGTRWKNIGKDILNAISDTAVEFAKGNIAISLVQLL